MWRKFGRRLLYFMGGGALLFIASVLVLYLVVDTKAITDIGIMTIEGENDDITGPGQCAAAHDLTPNVPAARHDTLLQPEAGHYGLFSGRRFRNAIYPRMKAFMAAQV